MEKKKELKQKISMLAILKKKHAKKLRKNPEELDYIKQLEEEVESGLRSSSSCSMVSSRLALS